MSKTTFYGQAGYTGNQSINFPSHSFTSGLYDCMLRLNKNEHNLWFCGPALTLECKGSHWSEGQKPSCLFLKTNLLQCSQRKGTGVDFGNLSHSLPTNPAFSRPVGSETHRSAGREGEGEGEKKGGKRIRKTASGPE